MTERDFGLARRWTPCCHLFSMAFFPAVLGALVKVTCPKCGEVQVRARRPRDERVQCRRCATLFTLAEGHAAFVVRGHRPRR